MNCKRIKLEREVLRKKMAHNERAKIRFLINMINTVDGDINKKVYPSFKMQLLSSEYKLRSLLSDS
jgi:hypothetical protein